LRQLRAKMHIHHKVCGFFKIEAFKKDGSSRLLADWFPNLITDIGMDKLATDFHYMNYCQVGSGNTVPSVSDIGLVSKVATNSNILSTTHTVSGTSPYYNRTIRIFQFNAGVAEGNLSEVGIGWGADSNLFSRALILDIGGSPTTITVLSDEYLQVTYEFRHYPLETDATGTMVFTGDIGGTYDYILRCADITTDYNTYQVGASYYHPTTEGGHAGSSTSVYTGSVGAITGLPSGTSLQHGVTMSNSTYVAGSFTLQGSLVLGITKGNISGGIGALTFEWGFNKFQIGFSPSINKTNQYKLTLVFTKTWARYTP